jgi:hypothetical protein
LVIVGKNNPTNRKQKTPSGVFFNLLLNLNVMKTQNSDYIEIPELGIKVQKEISGKMSYSKAEEYCKERGARMLNVLEAGHIYDNELINNFCREREWLEHYSKKTGKNGFGCSALGRVWDADGGLDVDGDLDGGDFGHSFGVRLVFPITDKARKE